MLNDLLAHENLVFALIRDHRFNPATRTIPALHALLGRQFEQQAERLAALSRRARATGGWAQTAWADLQDYSIRAPDAVTHGNDVIAQLAQQHERVAGKLHAAAAVCAQCFDDAITAALLQDLIAQHQQDATTLRALVWSESIAA